MGFDDTIGSNFGNQREAWFLCYFNGCGFEEVLKTLDLIVNFYKSANTSFLLVSCHD